MNSREIMDKERRYLAPTYVRPEVVFTHGEGVYLYDTDGKRYLDFSAGIAVNALGHSDPEWVQAICDQAGALTHVSNLYHTQPHVKLAELLVELSFGDRVFFCNSGAEANEGAIKFARKFARKQGYEQKSTIVHFSGAFHGRTMGALAITPREKYQHMFRPLMPDVRLAEFNDVQQAQATINDDVCAVFVEPVQGEGGIRPATQPFLQQLRTLCDRHNSLLVFDEVQCGLGRTGYLWAHQHYDVQPDMMTLAKPLAGGLPIGAIVIGEHVAQTIAPGDHASTFAAGPLVCRGAQVVVERVSQPGFLENVRRMGQLLQERLAQLLPEQKVVDIRGRGLMLGVEFNRPVGELIEQARAQGLLVINAGENVLRLVPPLTIEQQHAEQAAEIIAKCARKL